MRDENKLTNEKKVNIIIIKFSLYYLGKIEDSLKIYDQSLQLNNQNDLALNGKENCYFDMNSVGTSIKIL